MTPKTAAPTAPQSVNDFAAFRAAEERLADLHRQLTEAQQVEREAWEHLVSANDQATRQSPTERMAAALAAGESMEDAQGTARSALAASHAAAQERVALLKRATQLASERVDQARREASAAIAPSFRPEHKQHLRAVVDAMVQLARARRAEQRFRDDIAARGFTGSLEVQPLGPSVPDFGSPAEPGEHLWYVCRDAVGRGIMSTDEWAELRAEWQNTVARAA